jgi:hypothetical protein
MKFFTLSILNQILSFSKNLENTSILTDNQWVLYNEKNNDTKTIYIFRSNNQLLISINGKISKEKWEFIGDNTLILDIGEESYLFRNGFIDDEILALKQDSYENYAIFINGSNKKIQLKTLKELELYLENKYLKIKNFFNKNRKNNSSIITIKEIKNIQEEEVKKISNKIYITDLAYKSINSDTYIYAEKLTPEMKIHNNIILGITPNEKVNRIIYPRKKLFTDDMAYKYIDSDEYQYVEELTSHMLEHNKDIYKKVNN